MESDLLERAAAEIRQKRHNNRLWSDEDIARAVLTLALEEAAKVAETEGTYPELNVFAGGPDWYKHGKRVATAIRSLIPAGGEREKRDD